MKEWKLSEDLYQVDVYTAPIPYREPECVLPQLRQEQIENTSHQGLKRQRYFVWKLLEIALRSSFGYEMKDLHFSRDKGGKWSCKECFFSLSHRKDAVAVAVSRKSVGVDLECADHAVRPGLADKILTEDEKQHLPGQEDAGYLLKMWCAKEARFKADGDGVFQPKNISALSGVKIREVEIGGTDYILAVASENLHNVRFCENIIL